LRGILRCGNLRIDWDYLALHVEVIVCQSRKRMPASPEGVRRNAEPQRLALLIRHGAQLRVQPALRSPDQAPVLIIAAFSSLPFAAAPHHPGEASMSRPTASISCRGS